MLIKRMIDLAFGLVGIVLFSPIIAAAAIAIRLDSKGPILYRQERVGVTGKVFNLVKFRSMQVGAEDVGGAQWSQDGDPRITRLGQIPSENTLASGRLPQFLNVIRGEMSFVGPRPERPYFVEQLREQIPFYDERHSVRPGITGWAQAESHVWRQCRRCLSQARVRPLLSQRASRFFLTSQSSFERSGVVLFGAGR